MMEGTLPFTNADRTWPRLASSDLETIEQNTRNPKHYERTNYLSAPVTGLDASLVTTAAWDSRSPAISLMETKRTKIRGVGFAFLLAAFLGSCVTTELRAQVIVVPNSLATNDGNVSLTAPAGGPNSLREMRIYDAAQFGGLSGPSFLTQFAWRPDTTPGPSGPRSLALRIFASTTSRSVAGLSTTFAENIGADNTLVFSGTLIWATANLPGPGNTRQFDVVFPFTTPFLYDPAAGNLLLEMQFTANGEAIRVDAVSGNSAVNKIQNLGSSTAPTGDFGIPQVTQFTFEPPPPVTIRTSQVEVRWNSIANLTYQVQYRSDLTTNLWAPLGDDIRSTGATSSIHDSVVAGQPQKFYRVVLLP
jgi:hypothetical protein